MADTPKAIEVGTDLVDSRFGSSNFLRRNMKKVFPDHWSFLLGEIALYAFIIEILTGIFLTFFFDPSLHEVTYRGPYEKLQGVEVSQAYASALQISFEVRGGLLIRQIHHWAALVFVAAIFTHMLRIFFTGAFRRPREINWLIGIVMLTLAVIEGFIGYGIVDDLLSGIGLRITQGMILGIPVLGTFVSFLIFGGEFPGDDYIGRFYIAHVLLLPGILLALVSAHLMILWHQKHTQFPGPGRTERNVVGQPFYPYFMAKTGAFFFFTFGVLALLGTFAQINPIWLYGPYSPANVFAGAQPDWYVGFLEGSVRLMPGVETVVLGHTISWNIIVPAFVIPGILITFFALYPFIEQWATGDRNHHHLLDRPRNAPTRTGIGVAGMIFYAVLWMGGGNDIIGYVFEISLQATTWILRVLLFVGPVFGFMITRRICLGLQHKDRADVEHGYETGMIQRQPSGAFTEKHEELPEFDHAEVTSKVRAEPVVVPAKDRHGIPSPGGAIRRIQARASRVYTADDVDVAGEENGSDGEHGKGVTSGVREQEVRNELTESSHRSD